MNPDSVNEFFNEYASASMNGDARRIASFYARDFIAAAKDQSSAFFNDEKFLEWLNEVFKFNRETGLEEMTVAKINVTPLGKNFCSATVTWSALYAAKAAEKISFNIHYILRETEDSFKIVMYISEEDQEELMKAK